MPVCAKNVKISTLLAIIHGPMWPSWWSIGEGSQLWNLLMTEIIVRPSRDDDIAAIAEIYAYEVLQGTASFDEEPPSEEKMLEKRANILECGFPYMVAEVIHRTRFIV